MNAVRDLEWERLARTWGQVQEEPVDAAWVADLVRRQTRRLSLGVAIEVIVTVGILGGLAWWVVATGTRAAMALGAAAVAHSAAVWAFSVWNRAGVWRPLGETTLAYLALAKERCRRERRAARFVLGLLAVEAIPIIWWVMRDDRLADREGWLTAFLVPGAVVVFAVAWAIRTEVQARRLATRLAQVDRVLALNGVG
ncbi:MAG: hypothetical protein IT352_19015 [Gemmatimonadales bacterium]|nr:hypothetical protein [Gemmatimonadales bacterium]